jgi:hypothetical protein
MARVDGVTWLHDCVGGLGTRGKRISGDIRNESEAYTMGVYGTSHDPKSCRRKATHSFPSMIASGSRPPRSEQQKPTLPK